ncbi:hypothetical protein AAC387_Pa03g3870 [Persea americana]
MQQVREIRLQRNGREISHLNLRKETREGEKEEEEEEEAEEEEDEEEDDQTTLVGWIGEPTSSRMRSCQEFVEIVSGRVGLDQDEVANLLRLLDESGMVIVLACRT